MLWSKFENFFHESYHHKMKPFIESEQCDKIYKYLKDRGVKGHKIAPNSNLTFRCFKETPLNEIKVIIAGFCPYHTFINGNPVADGLAMGCSVTNKLQPSLEKFYEGIENELFEGLNLNYDKNPDLMYLAKQGVLLYNVALTTEMNKAGNHLSIWDPFAKYFFEEVVGYSGIPVIFLGKEASKAEKYVTPFTHTFCLDHPAYAARINSDWDTKGAFNKVSRIIKENNNFEIKWLMTEEETKTLIGEECPF